MSKEELKNFLQKYDAPFTEEQIYKREMLQLLEYCENCFERSCAVGHFTASAFVLDHKEENVLLMHHRKLDRWFQPGGHCDGDSDVLAVAMKEAREETGLTSLIFLEKEIFDLDVHMIPPYQDVDAHYHFDIRFLLKASRDEEFVQNAESKELRWFSLNDEKWINDNLSILRMKNKALARRSGSAQLDSRTCR